MEFFGVYSLDKLDEARGVQRVVWSTCDKNKDLKNNRKYNKGYRQYY